MEEKETWGKDATSKNRIKNTLVHFGIRILRMLRCPFLLVSGMCEDDQEALPPNAAAHPLSTHTLSASPPLSLLNFSLLRPVHVASTFLQSFFALTLLDIERSSVLRTGRFQTAEHFFFKKISSSSSTALCEIRIPKVHSWLMAWVEAASSRPACPCR